MAARESPTITGLDLDTVAPWLAGQIDLRLPLDVSRLAGGRSNLTYLLTDDTGRRTVLRRPPLGDLPATAHDVLREARLLEAVAGRVPVPAVLATCPDPAVTGAPFFVMEHLDGTVVRDPEGALSLDPQVRAAVGPSLVDALVALHEVDPDRLGLGDLAKRRDYAERQLRRWHRNWESTRTRDLPDLERTHAWLVEHCPEQSRSSIVHGDFRVDNCILGADGAVLGLLDWELSTVGDPLADLGQLLVYWAEPDDDFTALNSPPTRVPGFASRDELRDRYLAASGADPAEVAYYVVFNWWKTACIVEDVHTRMLRGAMGASDRTPESFGVQAQGLAARAWQETHALA
ncbi:phosphotransferase family protein [Nocardioides sp. Root151]|uniref:phosphotransferase family protein n=1 Tax=Nocardioides sp. Root151 TaxID=1736475 RepID=UPI000703B5F8|nr:phosphotransferase family protein [Nocardioides sp. Root151]KQZ74900.1 aminoglycoside phosphotransferase [Nocardioides sp. Root151]